MSTFKIGCIADDFTGAGDAASFLAAGGMSVPKAAAQYGNEAIFI